MRCGDAAAAVYQIFVGWESFDGSGISTTKMDVRIDSNHRLSVGSIRVELWMELN